MYKLVPTDKCFMVGGKWRENPVASLVDEYGGRCQIVVDDHCYVLYLLQGEEGKKEYKMTSHIFSEAFEVLKLLPDLK